MNEKDFFMHSIKPKQEDPESSDFKGISEKGVELAGERAEEILNYLEDSEKGTDLFTGAVSEIPRTKSTALAFGEKIKDIILEQDNKDVLVFMPKDLENIDGFTNKRDYLVNQISANPEKKIIVDFPLFVKEFSFNGDFTTKEGKLTPFSNELLERNGYDEEKALKDWLSNQGVIEDLQGPSPKAIAEKQLQGIDRLREFAEKNIPDRPIIIGSVGHSWSLDVLALYLINSNEVNAEAFDKIKAKMIGETGMVRLIKKEGKPFLQYGELEVPLDKKE